MPAKDTIFVLHERKKITMDIHPTTTVHPTATIDKGAHIAPHCHIWHYTHLMSDCYIGEGSSIGQNVFIGRGVRLGKGCKVQNNVSLYEGLTCDDNVFLGPSCVFTNVINPRAFLNRKDQFRPTHIEQGATIGANATILCGIRIGQYALIAAGAVVTTHVPPHALMTGIPARQTAWVSRHGHTLTLQPDGTAICPETQECYILQDGRLTLLPTTPPCP